MSWDCDEKRTIRGPGRGKPVGTGNRRQATRYSKCDVRLNSSENAVLDDLANQYGKSRSDIVRMALRDFVKFASGENLDD